MNSWIFKALPLHIIFVISTILIFATNIFLQKWNIDLMALYSANIILFLISLITFVMQFNALQNTNPNAFVRSVMGSMMIKMVIAVIAVVIYAIVAKKSFNKPAIFIALVLYIIYLIIEVVTIMKLNKKHHA